MRKSIRILIPTILLVASGAASAQTTWYVDGVHGLDTNAGTSPAAAFQTVSWGLARAQYGDTVQVAAGVYTPSKGESFPMGPIQGVALIGADPRTTIIDAENATTQYGGDLVRLDSNSSFRGFTIRNGAHGSQSWWSGAIHIDDFMGGGLRVDNVTVERCVLDTINRAFYVGNPWDCVLNNIVIRNNVVIRASADAIGLWGDRNSASSGNRVHNNTIIGGDLNHTTRDGVFCDNGVQVDIENNIIYCVNHYGIGVGGQGTCAVNSAYNNIFTLTSGREYTVNAAAAFSQSNDTYNDPMFVDNVEDPHLLHGSPCIDAGDPTITATADIDGNGLQGNALDQGADEHCVEFLEADLYAWPTVEGGATTTFTVLGQPGDYTVIQLASSLSAIGAINLGSAGFLYLDPQYMFALASPMVLDASGKAQVAVPVPPARIYQGAHYFLQSINFPPSFTRMGLSDLEDLAFGR